MIPLLEIASRLGDAWCHDSPSSSCLLHRPTGLSFVLVEGGHFIMGLREDDIEEASEYCDWTRGVAEYVEEIGASARPPHVVLVRPFLCATVLLEEEGYTVDTTREAAIRMACDRGLRLVSEAELEWLLRDGGRFSLTMGAKPRAVGQFTFESSSLGIQDPASPQWAADDWHPSYEGAPAASAPWMDGDPAGVCRSNAPIGAMQAEEDVVTLLAAVRTAGSEALSCAIRLACDVPG
ncbi:MAG: hypothetical protein JW751_03515 [Polyangiaceae bacterium]|nr:hypothetical protein [Polyangiaceae bacterium]